ncbi:Protein MMS22-like protein, partial [Stegodyphus mimosarum]
MRQTEIFCNELDELNPFIQVSMLILSDFLCNAVTIYRNSSSISSSPFMCKCVEEFWLMLIYILDKNNIMQGGNIFWNVYLNAIQRLFKTNSTESPDADNLSIDMFYLNSKQVNYDGILEPCLWLTTYIASLYRYDAYGKLCEDKK